MALPPVDPNLRNTMTMEEWRDQMMALSADLTIDHVPLSVALRQLAAGVDDALRKRRGPP